MRGKISSIDDRRVNRQAHATCLVDRQDDDSYLHQAAPFVGDQFKSPNSLACPANGAHGPIGVEPLSDVTNQGRLEEYRAVWERKPVLRTIYKHYYRRITALTVSGRTLEIGGGSGNLKQFLPDVVSTDILPGAWLDTMADAQRLPFRDCAFDNIVFVDVLHHIEDPAAFFAEASRVLRDGGRIVMVEPAITPVSYPFYKFIHQEPVLMKVDPLCSPARREFRRDPFDSNQAIPSLLFGRHRAAFGQRFPEFTITTRRFLSLVAYPLSGGFQRWCLIPRRAVSLLLRIEDRLEGLIGPLMGFRLLVALSYREPQLREGRDS